jgi:hypothetical protein
MRDLSEILTIGLPFCVFKAVTGLHLGGWAGGALLALAVLDTITNAGNLIGFVLKKKRWFPVCTLTALTGFILRSRTLKNERRVDLGNAIDMLLALVLVAGMVGFGRIGQLPASHIFFWNLAVVLNVLGAGLSRLNESVQQLRT